MDQEHPVIQASRAWDAATYARQFSFVSELGASVVELLDPQPGESVIDLGCGTGELAAAIAARGAMVTGLDADVAMIAAAREAHPTLRFEVADGHAFSVEQPADAVFSNAALHWMTRPADVVRCVHTALRPGGRFVAEFGGHGNVAVVESAVREALVRQGVPREQQGEPWYFPTPGEYASLLEAHGFEVRALWLFDRLTPLEGGERGLRDWVGMFAPQFFGTLTAGQRDAVLDEIEEATRDRLYVDGRWHVDYRRLRFMAVRL